MTPRFVLPLAVPTTGLALTDTLPTETAQCDLSVFPHALEPDRWANGQLSFTAGLELVLRR